MHFAFGLEIKATGSRREEILNHIWNVLLGNYKRSRRLGGHFFIIKIKDYEEWTKILDSLKNYANSQTEKIYFIFTPAMTGGKYNGLLPKGDWDFINDITSE